MASSAINPNLSFLRDNHLNARILCLQGGTRSGKTYSALQFIIELCYTYPNAGQVITVARETFPALRGSALRDFIEILASFGAYNERNHNKTEQTYNLNGNLIEFISLDQPQKVRGRKRHILFVNEANEITVEGWRQLMLRTTGFAIIDFNPSDPVHWIYDEAQPRNDCRTLITTYKDNPHLEDYIVQEIERYKDLDPEYWKVYGEGHRSSGRKGQIFKNWITLPDIPWEDCSQIVYGVDFGFSNDPTAVVKVGKKNDRRYLEEVIYERGLHIDQLSDLLHERNVPQDVVLMCDSAEPRSIADLRRKGWQAVGVKKTPDYLDASIRLLQGLNIFVLQSSKNILHEQTWYTWELDKRTGEPTNKPLDAHNHLMDATRYAEMYQQREIHI